VGYASGLCDNAQFRHVLPLYLPIAESELAAQVPAGNFQRQWHATTCLDNVNLQSLATAGLTGNGTQSHRTK
jgi:hypothetical protein